MQPIDFYKLSRPVQERFVGSVNGAGLPAPILRARAKPTAPAAWFAAAAASLVAVVVFYRVGYGDLGSGVAIQGVGWMGAYVAAIAFAVFGVLRGLAILRDHGLSPFRRGIYVFPVGVIDARSPKLRLYPIEDLANVVGPDANGFTLDFGNKTFAFPVTDGAQAESAKSALASARGKIEEAGAARESIRPKALAALDPLQGYANPLVSSEPMVRSSPTWATFAWVFALITGGVLGVSAWAVRNAKSDDVMYARAVAANDTTTFRVYLAKAARHKAEVSSLLLPRAELREVQKAGTVAAIEQFIKDHPQTAIGPEATAALKAAMTTELNVAIAAGTLAAIDDFTRRHPQSHLDAEVKTARHAVYQAAFDRYAAAAPAKATAETAFVHSMLAWAETKGPPVEIRFHRLESKTVDKADNAVQKNRLFKGVVSLPSRYFDAAHDKPYEDALGSAVVQRFASVFPTEIVALAVGEPISDPAAPLPAQITVPTLFIEHGTGWSGSVVASHAPNGVFAGLELSFTALFRLPDDTKPIHVKVDGWHAPNTAIAKDEDKPEEVIYARMHSDAYEQFQRRLLGSFFKGPNK
jgi:hypothetical protein